MIQKIEQTAIQLRFVFLALFIIATIIAAICYADEHEEQKPVEIMAFWPPDMVPHLPPHFPEPKPNEPVVS